MISTRSHLSVRACMSMFFAGLLAMSAISAAQASVESTASEEAKQIAALQERVTALEAQLSGGEITVERINVHQIAPIFGFGDPDNPDLIITDADNRMVIGVNGLKTWSSPRLGFFGAEPHPRPKQASTMPSAIDVAQTVAATGLIESP